MTSTTELLERDTTALMQRVEKLEAIIAESYEMLRDVVWADDTGEIDRIVAAIGDSLTKR